MADMICILRYPHIPLRRGGSGIESRTAAAFALIVGAANVLDTLPIHTRIHLIHTTPLIIHIQCCGTVTIYYGSGSGSDF
jgi:hypothetical protein